MTWKTAKRRMLCVLACCAFLAGLLGLPGISEAATHTITKVAGTTIALPAGLTNGDKIVVAGDRLEPIVHTTSDITDVPGGDWRVLRECPVSFDLLLTDETKIEAMLAFAYCANLTSISLPAATDIGAGVFLACTALTSVSLPAATDIGGVAFDSCSALTSVSLPAATGIGVEAFCRCTALTSVSLPKVTSIGTRAFDGCANLKLAILPKTEPNPNNFPPQAGGFDTLVIVPDTIAAQDYTTYSEIIKVPEPAFSAMSSVKGYVIPADSGSVTLENDLGGVTDIKWHKDGALIAGATNKNYSADENGVYQMEFTYNTKIYALPANRVVIRSFTPPAFADGSEATDSFGTENGYALDRTFKITGGPASFDVVNPLSPDVTVTTAADAVTLKGTLPEGAATYTFTLTATAGSEYAFWTGEKLAVATFTYRAEVAGASDGLVSPDIPISTDKAAELLNGSETLKGRTDVAFAATLSPDVINELAENGITNPVMITTVSGDAMAAKTVPETLPLGTNNIAPSFNVKIPTTQGNILPVSLTVLYGAISSDLPEDWTTMASGDKAKYLADDGDDGATYFSYEYVPASGDAAIAPVNLIGPGCMLTWGDAIDAGIVTFGASGDLTVNYMIAAGKGEPFAAENYLVIPDKEPYPGYLTDPAWLLKTKSNPADPASSSSGVGCGTGAGILALLALVVLRKRHP